MYTTVIFDLDGTLLDTVQDLANAGNYALSAMGFPKHETEIYKVMIGNGIPKLVERMLPVNHRGKASQEIANKLFSEYYQKHMQDFTKPYPGILELVKYLKENKIKIGVATNKANEFAQEVVEYYFPNMFDVVIGTSKDLPAKPNPKMVEYALQKLNAEKEKTLYCGDSDVDMQTANNCNLASCGVLWGFRSREELEKAGATYLVENAKELKEKIID